MHVKFQLNRMLFFIETCEDLRYHLILVFMCTIILNLPKIGNNDLPCKVECVIMNKNVDSHSICEEIDGENNWVCKICEDLPKCIVMK